MDKARNFGFLSLAIVTIAAIVGIVAAVQERWAVSVSFVFVVLLVVVVLVLFSLRIIKWQMFTDLKKARNETRKVAATVDRMKKQNQELLSSMTREQKLMTDQREDALVVMEASIANLNTRVQRVLDANEEHLRKLVDEGKVGQEH